MLDLPLLQAFVHSELQSLLVGSHLVGLLGHQLGLRGKDLLVPSFFVEARLLILKLMDSALHLMRLLIVLLLCQVGLNSLEIEKFS